MGRKRANLIKRAELWFENEYHLRIGSDYKSFLTIRDVPSRGRSHRILSWTVGRQHHLLSDFEASFFYLSDYAQGITDIREQYPLLPMEETLSIANKLGVRHPGIRGQYKVMTTDFLLTKANGSLRAVACKFADELKQRRVRDKLAIEKYFWTAKGIPWYIVTDKQVSRVLAGAVEWVHNYQSSSGLIVEQEVIPEVLVALKERLLASPREAFGPKCLDVDADLGLDPGTGLSLVRHALATRKWHVDLRNGIDTMAPMPWYRK